LFSSSCCHAKVFQPHECVCQCFFTLSVGDEFCLFW